MNSARKLRRKADILSEIRNINLDQDPELTAVFKRPTLSPKRFSSPAGSFATANNLNRSLEDFQRIPSPDVGRSRSGLSRRHYYGSLETLNVLNGNGYEPSGIASKFRIESGELGQQNGLSASGSQGSVVHLENPEFHTRWYFKYFLGKVHQNYVALDNVKNPIILSVCLTDADNYGVPQYRAILWRKTGSEKICIPYSPSKPISAKVILKSFSIEKLDKGPREVSTPEFQQELLTLEEQEGSVNFKFGVLFAKAGQTSDDEMFSNETGSEEFNNFLDLLGDRVTLQGWQGYRGGLDVKHDMTGSHSVFTIYEGHEIMFHVSSLLPYTPDNPQQVERKRHIGNDIVTVVFQDAEDEDSKPSFTPLGVKSKFIHIFALVTHSKRDDSYRVAVYSEKNVPIFGPPLPCPPVFHSHQEFRNFLLVKLMNGEKAAYSSPIFSNRRQRTLESLITRLWQEHMHEKVGGRKSWGDAISDSSRGHRRKQSEREQLFLQYGQSLKLKTIVKGDAPTSLVTTSANIKVEPWQPHDVYEDFPFKIICGDSWGDNLFLGTDEGIVVVQGTKIRTLFDRTVITRQLSVVEPYGLLLFRVDKGKEFKNPRICVFKLSDFEEDEEASLSKSDCKSHKLDKTKGCHFFYVNYTRGTQPLFMAVACGKRILLMKWKHPLIWSSWAVGSVRDMTEGFEIVKEVSVSEPAVLVTVLLTGSHDPLLCVGYKNHFDLVHPSGETQRIHSADSQKKTTLVSAIDVYDDDKQELLLTFNHQSIFKGLNGEQSSAVIFNWNSAPQFIVCAFPYLLAFTTNTIEIRLVVNGNLVHTLVLPNLDVITSKLDIYFASCPHKTTKNTIPNGQSSHSPFNQRDVTSVHKISLFSLMGQFLTPVPALKIPECAATPPQLLRTSCIAEKDDEGLACRRVSLDPKDTEKALLPKPTVTRTASCPINSCAREQDDVFPVWTRRDSEADLSRRRRPTTPTKT